MKEFRLDLFLCFEFLCFLEPPRASRELPGNRNQNLFIFSGLKQGSSEAAAGQQKGSSRAAAGQQQGSSRATARQQQGEAGQQQ